MFGDWAPLQLFFFLTSVIAWLRSHLLMIWNTEIAYYSGKWLRFVYACAVSCSFFTQHAHITFCIIQWRSYKIPKRRFWTNWKIITALIIRYTECVNLINLCITWKQFKSHHIWLVFVLLFHVFLWNRKRCRD